MGRPTVDMVATVVDTGATATTATVDIVARGRLRLLLLPSPRLMLRPTEVDTSEDMEAMVATDMVATVARGRPRPMLTVDMADTEAMVATDMVVTVARGRLRPKLTVDTDKVDTAAMVAMDMVATVVRGRLRLPVSMDMVDTEAVSAATDTMVIDFIVE